MNRVLDSVLPLPERDWDADWRVRLPTSLVLASSRALLRRDHANNGTGEGDRVLALLHLGDQIRMLNVLSRFPNSDIEIDTNAEAAAPVQLYEGVRLGRTFRFHGLLAPFERLPRQHRLARMLIPHPTMTMPSALAHAGRLADQIIAASTGEFKYDAPNVRFIRGDRSSWRRFYESFFEASLGCLPITNRPRLREPFRFRDARSQTIYAHLSAGLAERSMPIDVARKIVRAIDGVGYDVRLLGTESERDRLVAIAGESGATLVVNRPLTEVAELLASAHAFVGLESSMGQLADAVGLPSSIIYSATTPEVQGPFYSPTSAVRVSEPTIRDVAILTGRLGRPKCDWAGISERVTSTLSILACR